MYNNVQSLVFKPIRDSSTLISVAVNKPRTSSEEGGCSKSRLFPSLLRVQSSTHRLPNRHASPQTIMNYLSQTIILSLIQWLRTPLSAFFTFLFFLGWQLDSQAIFAYRGTFACRAPRPI
ncbi:hypothetical protein CDAR_417351 [Caerostris darwini]|uniref:Uncharacterized protein n=1 Tax=Caerostris darwini TaxID=1538125 RepID=A0AAV4X576_9ARAC|nr:hypothetical protein CDAR_417351 [Caerostris darwini]